MSIRDESAQESAAFTARRLKPDEEYGTSFLHLYNKELIEFVRLEKDGTYTPVDWPKQATHELVPSQWNNRKNYKPNSSGKVVMMDGFASAVCAVPLRRKNVMCGTMIKARLPLPEPKKRQQYKTEGSLEGKRAVLLWMAAVMRADVKKRTIYKATSSQCDNIYRNLLAAHGRLV